MAKKLAFSAALVALAALLVLVATAAAGQPTRLDFSASGPGGQTVGWIQPQFWQEDRYQIHGVTPNGSMWVAVQAWNGTLCGDGAMIYREELPDLVLTANNGGAVHARYSYQEDLPTELENQTFWVEYLLLDGQHGSPLYYSNCMRVDLTG